MKVLITATVDTDILTENYTIKYNPLDMVENEFGVLWESGIRMETLEELAEEKEDDQYIVLEAFGGAENLSIVTDEDGNNIIFNSREKAEELATELQDGIILEL